MPNWLSKVFSLDRDPIIERLMKVPTIFNTMKQCFQSTDSLPKSSDLRNIVMETTEKLLILLQGVEIHQISKNTSETTILANFIIPILQTFQILDPEDARSVSLLTSLHLIFQIVPFIPPLIDFSHCIIHMCIVQSIYPGLAPIISDIELYLFKDKEFTHSICRAAFLKQSIDELFPVKNANDAIYMLYSNLSKISDIIEPEMDQEFVQLIPTFFGTISTSSAIKTNIPEAILLISQIIYIDSKKIDILKYFDLESVLNTVHSLLVDVNQLRLGEFIYTMSIIPFGFLNSKVMLYINDKISIHPVSPNSILSMLKAIKLLIQNSKFSFSEIENYFHISAILLHIDVKEPQIHDEILQLFIILADLNYPKLSQCIEPVLPLVTKYSETSISVFNKILEVINQEIIHPEDLLSVRFIDIFILDPKIFSEWATKSPQFVSVTRECYKIIRDSNLQWLIFSKFLSLESQINHSTKFVQLCSTFLIINPNSKLFSQFMDYITKNPKESYISIFITSFCETNIVAPIFIRSFGLDWINQLIENEKFPQHMFSVFFSSLLHHQSFPEVNVWIASLPLSHPIFHLEQPLIFHIVFGSNATSPNILRVPALLPLLPEQNIKLSSYATYEASKNAMGEFIRHGAEIDNNQLVAKMANRYLTSDQFIYLLNNSKNVSSFCDISSEPFEMFEFAPMSRNAAFTINQNYFSLCFWLKYESSSSPITILTNDLCSIFLQGNFICLQVRNVMTKLMVQVKTWEFISLTISDDFQKIILSCNKKKCQLDLKNPVNIMSNVTFGSFQNISTNRWFISNIRLFSSYDLSVFAQIHNKGPRNFTPIADETVITPFSYIQNKGDGVLSVPYFGFASFFSNSVHFVCAIEEILKSESKTRIHDLVQALLNSFILIHNISDYWSYMKIVLKEKREFLDPGLLEFIFDLFFSSAEDLTTFNIFFADLDIWYDYHDGMLKSLTKVMKSCSLLYVPKSEYLGATLTTLYCSFNYDIKFINYILKFSVYFHDIVLFKHFYHAFLISNEKLKLNILEMLVDFFKTSNFDTELLSEVFTFKVMMDLLSVSNIDQTAKILELITIITKNKKEYVTASISFSLSIMHNIVQHSIWTKLFSIAIGEIENEYDSIPITKYESQRLSNPCVVVPIIILVCCSFTILTVVHSENNSQQIKDFEKDLSQVVRVLSYWAKFDSNLFLDETIYDLLLFFTPMIFDPSKLFASNKITVLKHDDETKSDLKTKVNEVYTIWDATDFSIGLASIVPQSVDNVQLMVSPFISFLLPVISYFRSDIKFPIQSFTSMPKYLSDNVNVITDFFASFLVSSISHPTKFTTLFRIIVFDSPIKNLPGYSDFSSRFICSLLCRPQVINAPIKSLNYLFSTVCIGLQEHSYGEKPGLLVSSCLTVMKAVFSVSNKDKSMLVVALRHIINSMFANCTTDEILSVFEILNSMNDFVYQIHLFDDVSFTAGFLVSSTNINAASDKRFTTFYNNFIDNIILSDDFQNKWEKTFDSVSLLNLTKYVSGILTYINKGGIAFTDWIRENKDIYESTAKLLETVHREFDQNNDDLDIVETQIQSANFYNIRICSMTDSLNKRLLRIRGSQNKENIIIGLLVQNHLNLCQRITESSLFVTFLNSELSAKQRISNFSAKTFRVSPLTLPMMTPRVLCPTPYELPEVPFEETQTNEIFADKIEQTKSKFIIENSKDLFHRDFTRLISSIGMKILPTAYSSVSANNYFLFYSFLKVLESNGEPESVFNCLFVKYTEPVKSVIAQFRYCFVVLIGAQITNNSEIEILKDSQSPILHKNLVQLACLGLLGNCSMFCGHLMITIPYSSIIFSTYHYYLHKKNGFCINTLEGGEIILIPPIGQTFSSSFIKSIEVSHISNEFLLHTLPLDKVKNMWINKNLTTYEYLLFLNSYSGRSFADLSQYPVFPWVISNYTAESDPPLRDMSKPMGQIDSERAKLFDALFDSQKTHYYSAHYSMSSAVHYYLVRCLPFTFFEWDLHQGWDDKDRMFVNIENSIESCIRDNMNDVRELIPELFSFPELFNDVNKLGIGNLEVPPFAQNCYSFINHNRSLLEQSNIEQWIDLIFGYEQTGQAAFAKKNVFMPVFYHNYAVTDDETADSLSMKLSNWGQCPLQIFKKKHPSRTNEQQDLLNICTDNTRIAVQEVSEFPRTNLSTQVFDKICIIDVDKSTFTLDNVSTFVKSFSFAYSIRSSQNGLFIVVDFCYGISQVFTVTESKTIKPVGRSFSVVYGTKTSINGVDLVCTSIFNDNTKSHGRVIIWDFIRGTIHRHLEFENTVVDTAFDDNIGLLYVLTRTNLHVFSINGEELCNSPLPKTGLCLEVPKQRMFDDTRPVFVGVSSGDVFVMKYDGLSTSIFHIMTYKLNGPPIRDIVMDISNFALFVKDEAGKVSCEYTLDYYFPDIIV